MRFIDLKIRTKLFGVFGILILIGIMLVAFYVVSLLSFKKDINSFSKEFLPELELSTRLSNETQMVAFNMEGYYLTGKSENFKLARVELDSLKNTLSEGEQLLEKSKDLSKLEQNLSEARILIPQYEQTIMMAFKTVQEINALKIKINRNLVNVQNSVDVKKKAKKNVKNQVDKATSDTKSALTAQLAEKTSKLEELRIINSVISQKLKQNSDNLRNAAMAYTAGVASDFNQSITSSIYSLFLISLIAFALSGGIAVYISRKITEPLMQGIEFTKTMAKGDLTAVLNVNQKDEIGILAYNLQQMNNRIREIITYVASTSENLASASLELSSSSQLVSQGASEQASSAEEVSAAIEEMAANIQQNMENAKKTEVIAIKAEKDIYNGSGKVIQTVDAMREIANKISIIGDIAFQTNILALNAAVEAARAGEHGRGFGVVASEVGKLADRSKLAATEIDQLTKTSTYNAEEAGKLMKDIVPDIQKTSHLIQEISAANYEQSAGADQINMAIQQLNMVTQQNAATSEELATNALELSAQAEQLQDIISFFRLSNDESGARMAKALKKEEQKRQPSGAESQPEHRHGIVIDLGEPDNLDEEFERF
jgi:methyl-accepting chemotaxis protein